jgi:hypothetical protein
VLGADGANAETVKAAHTVVEVHKLERVLEAAETPGPAGRVAYIELSGTTTVGRRNHDPEPRPVLLPPKNDKRVRLSIG